MNSKEFTIWLKGFTEGVHEYNITPKQWDLLKEKLDQVSDESKTLNPSPYPLGVPNGSPFITTSPVDPYNPYKITCTPGTTITTTPGTGYITAVNSSLFTTSTATSLPSGSAISYTNSTDKTLLND
jgi:hypothetical protein